MRNRKPETSHRVASFRFFIRCGAAGGLPPLVIPAIFWRESMRETLRAEQCRGHDPDGSRPEAAGMTDNEAAVRTVWRLPAFSSLSDEASGLMTPVLDFSSSPAGVAADGPFC